MKSDTRRPLLLDTKELGRRPGHMALVQQSVPAPDHLGNDVIEIPEGAPIALELRMESVMEGVLISGSATASATGACVRCLEPIHQDVEVELQELFAYADRAAHHHEVSSDDDEDVHELKDEFADLEPVLRDAVVPALPFQPVCREDCPGLCSECGAQLAQDPEHHHEVIDPRWAALSSMASSDTETDEKRN